MAEGAAGSTNGCQARPVGRQDEPALLEEPSERVAVGEARLVMVFEGLTNEAIGSKLEVRPRTVSTHVSKLLAKLGVQTRGEAAAAFHLTCGISDADVFLAIPMHPAMLGQFDTSDRAPEGLRSHYFCLWSQGDRQPRTVSYPLGDELRGTRPS